MDIDAIISVIFFFLCISTSTAYRGNKVKYFFRHAVNLIQEQTLSSSSASHDICISFLSRFAQVCTEGYL